MVGVLAVAACSGSSSSPVADAPPALPDACPLPTGYAECLPHGFAQLDPDGMWQLTGTLTSTMEMSMPATGPFSEAVTIQRMGCTASLSYERPNALVRVDDTVIESLCDQGRCPRTVSATHVCVRASDGALVFVSHASHTSTMPGNYYSTSDVMGVLTPATSP